MPAKEPTALGWWLLAEMDRRQLSQTYLAGRMGVAQATISRWIYRSMQPETNKLNQLADEFKLDDQQRAEMFRLAGHNVASATIRAEITAEAEVVRAVHPIAAEIRRMLDAGSPIPDGDRQLLETLLDRVIDPYRKVMRRRKTG